MAIGVRAGGVYLKVFFDFVGQKRTWEVFLYSFLDAARFILTEYEPVGSHGNPIHDKFYRFGTYFFVSKLSDFDPEQISQ